MAASPQTVLIAIDWSEYAEKAFDWYVYHLHRKGTKVVLAHYIDAEKEKELKKKQEELIELQEMYENRLLQLKIEYEWVNGVGCGPAEHVLKTAERTRTDMIVMGARGLSKLKKAILGSVSEKVLRKSTCPVLVVKSPEYRDMYPEFD